MLFFTLFINLSFKLQSLLSAIVFSPALANASLLMLGLVGITLALWLVTTGYRSASHLKLLTGISFSLTTITSILLYKFS